MRQISILFLSLVYIVFPIFSQEDIGKVNVGEGMPEFSIIHDDGSKLTFSSYLDKILLISFFKIDCATCQILLRDIERSIWPEYKDYINFISLPIGVGHTDEELKRYNEEKEFPFPLYPDEYGEIFDRFALGESVPHIYLVDIDNKVLFISKEYTPEKFDELKRILNHLLNITPVYDDPRQKDESNVSVPNDFEY